MTPYRSLSRFATSASSPAIRQLRAEVMSRVEERHQHELARLRAEVARNREAIRELRASVERLSAGLAPAQDWTCYGSGNPPPA